MGMPFNAQLNAFFQSSRGAYSQVTQDEFNKSQITFVGPEQELAESFFGDRLTGHHGSIGAIRRAGHDPEFEFRVHPSGIRKKLTVSYKTNRPNELRFYARKDVFKPFPGEYWCLFQRGSELWLGSFTDWTLKAINENALLANPRHEALEKEIDDYQDVINISEPEMTSSVIMRWKRRPKIASLALSHARFICELHPEYPTFFFRGTTRNFVEAHHLVPMSFQDRFENASLDELDNICVLNPLSHRMLHHADFSVIEGDLIKMIERRNSLIGRLGLNKYDVLEMYYS
jgi:5-methylcytosine-specific restriction enzyme A